MIRTNGGKTGVEEASLRPGRKLREDDPWLLKRLVESINSGLIVLDGEDRVVTFNPAAELITGFAREEVMGRPFAECLGAGNHEIITSELSRSSSPRENREVTLLTRTGARVPIGYTSSPLADEAGERVGTCIIFKDLTEIYALREEMSRREHLATIGEMTALIAHEIRNPLAAMHTAAETLKGELGYDEEKEEYLDIIIREIKRVASLVSDFFAYVKPVVLKSERVDLHELLDLLVFIEGGKMKKSGVRVASRYGPGLPPILADRNLLQQAILNILLNAFQATGEGGEVAIETQYARAASGSYLKVSITDSGEGILPEDLNRIFKPFYSTRTKGIGLGLPITERIVKAMNGRIEVASTRGRGSTFTLVIPAVTA